MLQFVVCDECCGVYGVIRRCVGLFCVCLRYVFSGRCSLYCVVGRVVVYVVRVVCVVCCVSCGVLVVSCLRL